MAGGEGHSPKSTNWKGYSKRRCCTEGCKKKARYFIFGRYYCKRCVD